MAESSPLNPTGVQNDPESPELRPRGRHGIQAYRHIVVFISLYQPNRSKRQQLVPSPAVLPVFLQEIQSTWLPMQYISPHT